MVGVGVVMGVIVVVVVGVDSGSTWKWTLPLGCSVASSMMCTTFDSARTSGCS